MLSLKPWTKSRPAAADSCECVIGRLLLRRSKRNHVLPVVRRGETGAGGSDEESEDPRKHGGADRRWGARRLRDPPVPGLCGPAARARDPAGFGGFGSPD